MRGLALCDTSGVSFGKRGVWADVINSKRICRDAVVPIEQKTRMLGLSCALAQGPVQAPWCLATPEVVCGKRVIEEIVPCVGSLVEVPLCF